MTVTNAPGPEDHVKTVASKHLRQFCCVRHAHLLPGAGDPPLTTPCLPPPLLPTRAQGARYLLGRGLLSVGVIVGEGPVEGGDVQAAVSTGEQAKPGLAGGGVAHGGIGVVQALRNALYQHYSGRRGVVSAFGSQRQQAGM